MSEAAWTVYSPRHGWSFRPVATRQEAEAVAADFRRDWPDHTFIVKRDPQFRLSDIRPGTAADYIGLADK